MPALTVTLPREAIEAFEQAARTLALAEGGTEARGLMAVLLAGTLQLGIGEALASVPLPAGGELVILELGADESRNLGELARKLGIEPADTAARLLVALARQGPAAALQAINSRRIGRRSRKDRNRR